MFRQHVIHTVLHYIAIALLVLPLVASISVSPGLISPSASARVIMLNAARALTEPAGLSPSNLEKIVLLVSPAMRCNLTNDVLPTKSSNVFMLIFSSFKILKHPYVMKNRDFTEVNCWILLYAQNDA